MRTSHFDKTIEFPSCLLGQPANNKNAEKKKLLEAIDKKTKPQKKGLIKIYHLYPFEVKMVWHFMDDDEHPIDSSVEPTDWTVVQQCPTPNGARVIYRMPGNGPEAPVREQDAFH